MTSSTSAAEPIPMASEKTPNADFTPAATNVNNNNNKPSNLIPVADTLADDDDTPVITVHDNGCSSLTVPVYLFFVAQICIWILFFVWMWELGCALVLFYIPSVLLVAWWNANRSYCTLNHICTQFAHGFVVVFLGVNIVLYLFLFVVGYVVFLMTSAIDSSHRLFWFVIALIYVCIEESFKIYFARRSATHDDESQVTKKHLMASVATFLGYSTATSLLWTVILVGLVFGHLSIGWFFFITFFLSVIGLPLHVLAGYLVGLHVMKKKKFIVMLRAPVAFRSVYLWLLLALLMAETMWLAILSIVLIVLEYVAFVVHIKRVERTLPFDYLRRVGQLNLFGYGVLPDGPEADDDEDLGGDDDGHDEDHDGEHTTASTHGIR